MKKNIRLTDLKQGQKAVICGLSAFDDMRRRMQDIGLIEGTVVECVGKSPLGDPVAYAIRGAVIALRSEDSSRVEVCPAENAGYVYERIFREKTACAGDTWNQDLQPSSKVYTMEAIKQEERPWG